MISKHFAYTELACPCCNQLLMDVRLVEALEDLRQSLDRPFIINSGYRCSKHNEKVGGRLSSRHLQGLAVDISTKDWPADDLHFLVFSMTSYTSTDKEMNTGIGIYQKHIHFDLRADRDSLWINL